MIRKFIKFIKDMFTPKRQEAEIEDRKIKKIRLKYKGSPE
tara:strand:+ start:55 stop:174 length:120 start_codon:yes stop_codon:yes gene_type:complete